MREAVLDPAQGALERGCLRYPGQVERRRCQRRVAQVRSYRGDGIQRVVGGREALRLFVHGEAGGLYLLSGRHLVLQHVFGDGVVGDFDPRRLGELGKERLLPRLVWAITRPHRDARGRRDAGGGLDSRSSGCAGEAESGAEHRYGSGCCAPDKPGSLA